MQPHTLYLYRVAKADGHFIVPLATLAFIQGPKCFGVVSAANSGLSLMAGLVPSIAKKALFLVFGTVQCGELGFILVSTSSSSSFSWTTSASE